MCPYHRIPPLVPLVAFAAVLVLFALPPLLALFTLPPLLALFALPPLLRLPPLLTLPPLSPLPPYLLSFVNSLVVMTTQSTHFCFSVLFSLVAIVIIG